MRKLERFSLVQWLVALNGLLVVCYIALIAVVMSYAALHVEFADSVRSDEAQVATLETQYLDQVQQVTTVDYTSLGYEKPVSKIFVAGGKATALR